MTLSLDEKALVKKYNLSLACSLKHKWYDKTSDGEEVCEAIKQLKSLPNFVYGEFNQCNNGYGGCHYVLLRNIAEAPYNYAMIYYHDRGPLSEYPLVFSESCPLNIRMPEKILLQPEDVARECDDSFHCLLKSILKEQYQLKNKSENKLENKSLIEELELLCEVMELNMEMKTFVQKENGDYLFGGWEEIDPPPKPNIDGFGGKEYNLSEHEEEEWKIFSGTKRPKSWKKRNKI